MGGFDTPALLALVEQRGLGGTRRSWLLTRWESTETLLRLGDADRTRESVRRAGRLLARLHDSGLRYRGLDPDDLRVRPGGGGEVVLTGLSRLRVDRRVRVGSRVSDLARLALHVEQGAPELPRAELALLLAAYREGSEAADTAWREVFSDVEPG